MYAGTTLTLLTEVFPRGNKGWGESLSSKIDLSYHLNSVTPSVPNQSCEYSTSSINPENELYF